MKCNVFWFRRDLRLNDNAGLFHALMAGKPLLPLFIFDTDILGGLGDKSDRRVEFIFNAVIEIDKELRTRGSKLLVLHGRPSDIFRLICDKYDIDSVYTNNDYEPYAVKRDSEVAKLLSGLSAKLFSFKDQVIFEKDEVVKSDGKPYTVYTPYSKLWQSKLKPADYKSYETEILLTNFAGTDTIGEIDGEVKNLEQIGFSPTGANFPSRELRKEIIKNYDKQRDYPAIDGTSRLSVHLRFGTVSIRYLAAEALKLNDTWLKELIWREFFMSILYHFPRVAAESFKPQYDKIKWRNNETEFNAWCRGNTGYPIVDAGMRELNETGFMHNRVRMITASFLCKHLLIDWRWGETYFSSKLLDYDLSANNGNWQWAAGTGCDAAPYFRVFSPKMQTKKFDPEHIYIKKWVPEFESSSYPKPIVEHSFARERALKTYREALKL